MLTVKQHRDFYAKMMKRRKATEAKQWKKYWDGKLKGHSHNLTIKSSRHKGLSAFVR